MSEEVVSEAHKGCECGCSESGTSLDPKLGSFWQRAFEDQTVCYCGQVTKAEILGAIEKGAYTPPMIKILTGAGQGGDGETKNPRSRCCATDIKHLIETYGSRPMFSFG